jgi:putative transposase
MDDLFLLSEAQMRRIKPHFPQSHGIARVDDRRVDSGIVFVIQERVALERCAARLRPHKTIYNRFVRWSRLGVFNKIFAELASKGGKPRRLIIDATRLKAHRTAASLLKKGALGAACRSRAPCRDECRWAINWRDASPPRPIPNWRSNPSAVLRSNDLDWVTLRGGNCSSPRRTGRAAIGLLPRAGKCRKQCAPISLASLSRSETLGGAPTLSRR